MKLRSSHPTLIAAAALAALLGLAAPARAQSPGLVVQHFPLSLSQAQALARADEALRAAGLTIDAPTDISRGGHGSDNRALIHCLVSGASSLVDVEVAYNSAEQRGRTTLTFLVDYMRTGRAPTGDLPAESDWTTTYGKMHLVRQGDRVTGTYEVSGGTLEGTIKGGILRFRWKQTNGSEGAAIFTFRPDGTFTGLWSYDPDPDKANRSWDGKRA